MRVWKPIAGAAGMVAPFPIKQRVPGGIDLMTVGDNAPPLARQFYDWVLSEAENEPYSALRT